MLTKTFSDNLIVRTDFADFWREWAEDKPLDSLTPAGLYEAKSFLLTAQVPPSTVLAYFHRLADVIANTVGTKWEHFREIELIMDEMRDLAAL
jgi:hypothetical protein